jgi:hypothetical protein
MGLPVAIDALFPKEKLGAGGTHQQQRLNIKVIFYGPSFKGPGMSEKNNLRNGLDQQVLNFFTKISANFQNTATHDE